MDQLKIYMNDNMEGRLLSLSNINVVKIDFTLLLKIRKIWYSCVQNLNQLKIYMTDNVEVEIISLSIIVKVYNSR